MISRIPAIVYIIKICQKENNDRNYIILSMLTSTEVIHLLEIARS